MYTPWCIPIVGVSIPTLYYRVSALISSETILTHCQVTTFQPSKYGRPLLPLHGAEGITTVSLQYHYYYHYGPILWAIEVVMVPLCTEGVTPDTAIPWYTGCQTRDSSETILTHCQVTTFQPSNYGRHTLRHTYRVCYHVYH